jgi:hypothetical protein
MVSLLDLWLPILVSAIAVQIASTIIHMALPFWHNADYGNVGDDRPFVEGSRSLKSGMYMFPRMDWKTMTEEQKAAWAKGPSAIMYVRNPAKFSFGKTIFLYFLYCLVSAVFVAYIAGETLAPGTPYLRVFQIAGAVGTIFWAFGTNVSDAIWYGKPWSATIKYAIDGLLYGCLIGGVFGWLWPA